MNPESVTQQDSPETDGLAVTASTPANPGKAPPRLAVLVAARMRRFFLRCADRMLPTHLSVLEHTHSFAQAHVLSTMAELGIPDHLATGPKTAAELAAGLGCDPEAMHRLLRAAAVFDAVRLDQAGCFTSTRFTRVLESDHPSRAAAWCRYIGSASQQAAWADLTESIRTGDSAFNRVHGASTFDWFDTHPDEGRHFSAGLGGLTLAEAPAIVAAYPWPDSGVICDAGGGNGVLLAQLLKARPRLHGVLVESQGVLDQARPYLASQGVAERIELKPGDLLGRFDARADLYVLKWILHDWDDLTCERIIRSAAATMPSGTRLVVIEGDQEANRVDPRFSMIDLQMLVVTPGGRERSVDQITNLLLTSGLRPGQARRTSTGLVLVEGTKP